MATWSRLLNSHTPKETEWHWHWHWFFFLFFNYCSWTVLYLFVFFKMLFFKYCIVVGFSCQCCMKMTFSISCGGSFFRTLLEVEVANTMHENFANPHHPLSLKEPQMLSNLSYFIVCYHTLQVSYFKSQSESRFGESS